MVTLGGQVCGARDQMRWRFFGLSSASILVLVLGAVCMPVEANKRYQIRPRALIHQDPPQYEPSLPPSLSPPHYYHSPLPPPLLHHESLALVLHDSPPLPLHNESLPSPLHNASTPPHESPPPPSPLHHGSPPPPSPSHHEQHESPPPPSPLHHGAPPPPLHQLESPPPPSPPQHEYSPPPPSSPIRKLQSSSPTRKFDEMTISTSSRLSTAFTPSSSPSRLPAPVPAPGPGVGPERTPAPSAGSSSNCTANTTMLNDQCTYTIIIETGNIDGAGTYADVNVEFFDKYGNSVLFVDLDNESDNFKKGATDTFILVDDCLENICGMRLSHDDAGPDPSWFVDTVSVSVLYQTQVFNVFEWLSKYEPPYMLSKEITLC